MQTPDRQVVLIRITNESDATWSPGSGAVRAFKDGRELDVRPSAPFPAELAAGESIIRAFDVASWSTLGWGYELDLSGVLGEARDPTPFERFTTTKFGVWVE